MSDIREILQRAVEGVEPSSEDLDPVLERAGRRDRRSRLSAALVALAVAAAGIGFALATFEGRLRRPVQPASEPFPDFDRLRKAWTAQVDLRGFPMVDGAVQSYGEVILGREQGLVAFPKDCRSDNGACEPAWVARFASAVHSAPDLAHGVVYKAARDGIHAVEAKCGSGGLECSPLWIGRVPPDAGQPFGARVVGDRVIATVSRGENPDQYVTAVAFRVGCTSGGAFCRPDWVAAMGKGTVHSPGLVVGDMFYQQIGSRLVGFEADCGDEQASCGPSFVFETGGHDVYPIEAGDELIVTSGDGYVYAFPQTCPTRPCEPLWRGNTGGYLEGWPVATDTIVAATQGSSVVAFPLDCRSDGGQCDPVWEFDAEGDFYPSVQAAHGGRIIATDWSKGRIWALPGDCGARCAPAWVASTGSKAMGTQIVGESVLVSTDEGKMFAFPLDCSGTCAPIWTASVQGELITDILVDADGLYAVSVGAAITEVDRDALLTGFRETT
jgi:hypothetical protein